MIRIVARDRRIAAGTSARSLFISTTSAASIAIAVPEPIAIPTSACASAGASLMPSPTIATAPPFAAAWNSLSALALSPGSSSARNSSSLSSAAMACATALLSPVSIALLMPRDLSRATASAAPGLSRSPMPITPISFLLRAA